MQCALVAFLLLIGLLGPDVVFFPVLHYVAGRTMGVLHFGFYFLHTVAWWSVRLANLVWFALGLFSLELVGGVVSLW